MTADITAALRRGDTVAALEAARAAVAAEPENPAAHHLLSLALIRQGDLEAARTAIDQAILLAPDRAMYQLSRASLAFSEGDLSRAEAGMKEALALDPNELPAYVGLIHMALAQGRNADAEDLLKRARRVNAEHPHVLVAEGHLAQLKGQVDSALKCFSAAVVADPGFALAQVSLGLAYLQRGHHAFAEQALRNAIALDAANPGVLRALVAACRAQEKLPEALEALDHLIGLRADARTRSLRGQLRLAVGRVDEALDDLLAVLDEVPGHEAVLTVAVDLLMRAARRDEAIARVETALAISPSDANWTLRLRLAGGVHDEVQSVLDRWSVAMPDSPLCLVQRAHLHELQGRWSEAMALAKQALVLAPGLPSATALLLRGEVTADPQSALDRLSALQVPAEDADEKRALLGLRGLALDRLGRYDDAAAAWLEMNGIVRGEYPLPMPAAAEELPAQGGAGRLLWAPPGVRLERVFSLLETELAGQLLLDRPVTPDARMDGFGVYRARPGAPEAGSPQRWSQILEAAGLDPARVVDWIPHFDAYTAAALGQAHTVACLIDPRDALLNWMAFGSTVGYLFLTDPAQSAGWLARCLEALADHRDAHPEAVSVVAVDTTLAPDHPGVGQLQQAFGLGAPLPTDALSGVMVGIGGAPLQFPAGHWRHYREPLAEAFARLTPVAQRFGYAAE